MDHFKKDLLYFFGFLFLLFLGWLFAGGPERARETGSAENKFIEPVSPISGGETYDGPIKNLSPFRVEVKSDQSF